MLLLGSCHQGDAITHCDSVLGKAVSVSVQPLVNCVWVLGVHGVRWVLSQQVQFVLSVASAGACSTWAAAAGMMEPNQRALQWVVC